MCVCARICVCTFGCDRAPHTNLNNHQQAPSERSPPTLTHTLHVQTTPGRKSLEAARASGMIKQGVVTAGAKTDFGRSTAVFARIQEHSAAAAAEKAAGGKPTAEKKKQGKGVGGSSKAVKL